MEEHVVVYVSAAKGKSKVKRSRQLDTGDKLEYLRSEFDSLAKYHKPSSPLSLEESEENLSAELDRLPSPEPRGPKELEDPEEAEDLEEPKEHTQPKELEEAEEHTEPKESEEAKQQEEPKEKEPACRLDSLINGEVSQSKTVQAWHQHLLHKLRIASTPRKVTNSTFRDARKLFDVNCDKEVNLRNPGPLGGYEDIELLQFDPNFMSTEVVCRYPSCNNINPAAEKCGKRDLYLCPHHQQALRNRISDFLTSHEVSLSAEKPEPGHFAGYTSLISVLEEAFQTHQGKSPKVQEAILNVRNFLIITSTVLNPDEDNLGIALPPVVEILKLILENPVAFEHVVANLVYLLYEVIKMILSAFGVFYTWVALALRNPGAQLGTGIGGFIGAFTFAPLGPWGLLVNVAVGAILGRLIGNGIDNLSSEEKWQKKEGLGPKRQPHNQYPVYYFNGDAKGRLSIFCKSR